MTGNTGNAMNATKAGFGLGPIDVHVHLFLNGQSGLGGWSRQRWVMRPFLAAAARQGGPRLPKSEGRLIR